MRAYTQPQTEINPIDYCVPLCASPETLTVDSSTNTTTVLSNDNTLWDDEGYLDDSSSSLWEE